MLVRHVPATAFGTNCWIVAVAPGGPCLVVDPGFGVTGALHRVLREERLRPAAVLVTHGHADHVWSVTPLSRSADPPLAVHVHPGDRYRLRDPLAQLGNALGADLVPMLTAHLGPQASWAEPDTVVDLPAGPGGETVLALAGLEVAVRHTPGHTEGSVCFRFTGAAPAGEDVLLSGDLLFAGSVGRTDLPGADPEAMARSLEVVMAAHPDETVVLPGHGPATTVGAERAANPFLAGFRAGTAPSGRPGSVL
ncbi:MAG: MBL fold metallo-hydrolase [Kineosporiaceae bacterium]